MKDKFDVTIIVEKNGFDTTHYHVILETFDEQYDATEYANHASSLLNALRELTSIKVKS